MTVLNVGRIVKGVVKIRLSKRAEAEIAYRARHFIETLACEAERVAKRRGSKTLMEDDVGIVTDRALTSELWWYREGEKYKKVQRLWDVVKKMSPDELEELLSRLEEWKKKV